VSTRRAAVAGLLILLVAGSAACARAAAHPGARTVVVRIHYSHFEPSEIRVEPGETIRFVVENVDPIDHEFLVGDRLVQRIHELGTEAHHPRRPGEMSVPAHTTRVTTYTFPARDGSLIFGCHLPGHYAYGMRGEITIG
jgi:uncharacterized cupredoxin-like copper-binding protein